MPESLKGKIQVDVERHQVPATCPKCGHRFTHRIAVRVYQTVQRVIVNRVVDAFTAALGKRPEVKKAATKVRKLLGVAK